MRKTKHLRRRLVHRDQTVCQVVVHKSSKTTQNYTCKTVIQDSGFGRLREVLVYERFQLKGFDWKNLDVLDREWYIREVKYHDYVQRQTRISTT